MRFTRSFQSLFGDAMIIYEKIQGKVVETRSFFFNSAFINAICTIPNSWRPRDLLYSVVFLY